jgi:type II secretory pathway component GspD/PulD (secretin)
MGTLRNRSKFSPTAYLVQLAAIAMTVLISGAVMADTLVVEVIPLQHALADDILPLIRPFVDPQGAATGSHNQLIIKTTQANLDEIKTIVTALDRPPKTLRISVKQDIAGHSNIQEQALSANLRSGGPSGQINEPGLQRGATLGIRDAEGNTIRYRTINTHTNDDQRTTHFVTAVEGRPAFIQTGQSIPIPYSATSYDRYGARLQEGIDFRDVTSGFYVIARTNGGQVTLDIAPQLERANAGDRGVIDSRYSSTTLSGRLGEWIALGGANDASSATQKNLLAQTRRHDAEIYAVWVKVDLLP